MKTLLHADLGGRVPVPPEKRFLISFGLLSAMAFGVLGVWPAAGDERPFDHPVVPEGGLAVLVGWNEGLLPRLAQHSNLVVHVLESDPAKVDAARGAFRKAGMASRASAEKWGVSGLPYPDNFVNVLVAEGGEATADTELRRVLAPGGMAYVRQGDKARALTKERPRGQDDWTHRKHGPDGNPVSRDNIAACKTPNRLRWIADVLEDWSHAFVTAGGRAFVNVKDTVRARDAYNGALLWEGSYAGWGAGQGSLSTRYRVVATEERLYGFGGEGIIVVDAATGRRLPDLNAVGRPLDFIVPDAPVGTGVVVCRTPEKVVALDSCTGKALWSFDAPLHARVLDTKIKGGAIAGRNQQLYAGDGRVYVSFTAPKAQIVGLDLKTGQKVWESQDGRFGEILNLAMYADKVLLAFNDEAYFGVPTDGRGETWRMPKRILDKPGRGEGEKPVLRPDRLLDGKSTFAGCMHAAGLFWLREDLGTVFGDTVPDGKDRPVLGWAGFDPRTGQLKRRVGYPVRRDWGGIDPATGQLVAKLDKPVHRNWAGRCYDDIGTSDCILAQTMEIVPLTGDLDPKHIRGVRGQCSIGFVVANNCVYTPPNMCIGCYPMIRGAIAYEVPSGKVLSVEDTTRLEEGPAYGTVLQIGEAGSDDWPMYRHDVLRTGCAPTQLDHKGLVLKWESRTGGRLTQPVIADGRAIVVQIENGRLVAFDAVGGRPLWEFDAGSRIDTAPTVYGGLCIFGCHDGFVYCLRASDGNLVWRFNTAPEHRRLLCGTRIESPWPVFGAVLVYEGAVHVTAGHYSAIEGGLQFWGLDPVSGAVRYHQVFQGVKGEKAMVLPTHWYKNEDQGMNNVLSADRGRMRLYDQWGGWEFSPKDGGMVSQIGAVPQPGWPRGRISAGELRLEDRWVWAGWDRVTVSYLLRCEDVDFDKTLEMDPRTRFSGLRTRYMFFPDRDTVGMFMHTKGYGTRIEPEPWTIPTDPKIFGDHEGIFKDPERNARKAKLWQARTLDMRAGAVTITGDKTFWVAGTVGPSTSQVAVATGTVETVSANPPARLMAISMESGEDLASWPLPAAPAFEGIAVASGRLYISTKDGRLVCFGR